MEDWRLEKISLASKCEFFWTTNSDLYGDVTFLVGPEEEKIKGFKILLMVTSPVFEVMLGTTWTKARGQDGPIKLPHDPVIFRHFLRLLLTDTATSQSIEELKLSIGQVLELFFLSKEYLIPGLQKTLQEYIGNHLQVDTVLNICEQVQDKDEEQLEVKALDMIVVNAANILEQDDFLKISKPILLKILSNDNLRGVDELFLLNAAHRWAKYQATWDDSMSDDDKNKEKVDQLLRECLTEIRLPLITARDWALHVEPIGVLTKDETIELLKYLPLKAEEKKPRFGPILQLSESLSMKTEARHPSFSRLVLSDQIYNPGYSCTTELQFLWLTANKKVWIKGLGFCGPLHGDSEYEVTLSIRRQNSDFQSPAENQVIFAKEKSAFYFSLKTPILLKEGTWHKVVFELKGAKTAQIACGAGEIPMELGGITFIYDNLCNKQILEIQYTTE